VEVQALAIDSDGPIRRQVTGLDPRRFTLVAAVVQRGAGIPLGRTDLYGACAGGLRLDDPGCDLAVAAAIASAASGRPVPRGVAFVGEVALTGEVRASAGLQQRIAAARAAGITTVVAAGRSGEVDGVRVERVRHVREAVRWAAEDGARDGREGRREATART
jgi:DNA repair protein RadA/Sms